MSKARVETAPDRQGQTPTARDGGIGPRPREIEVTGWKGFRQRHWLGLVGVLNFLVFFVVWQLVQTYTPVVDTQWVPVPTAILKDLWENIANGVLIEQARYSFTNMLVAYLLSVLFGVPLGLIMGVSRMSRMLFGPYIWALYAAPTIAIAPVVILIFGIGAPATILVIAMNAFFPLAINTMDGVATVEENLVRAARVFGANRYQVLRRVVVPYTLPWILTGLRIAVTRALLGMVFVEVFFSPQGLGYLIRQASDVSDAATAYSVILIVVISSVLLVQLFRYLEAKFTPWSQEIQI
ncbi:MAG: ABC transporter permease [Acidothermales bacterium]|nr:ABC transporter permease [Acidothermales bacterium]